MREWLERHIYITERKFGLADYRKPIVWFDKMLVVLGLAASIVGQICCFIWCVKFTMGNFTDLQPIQLLIGGILAWIGGAYFKLTGHRGLIYHHMDLLVDYLDGKKQGKAP